MLHAKTLFTYQVYYVQLYQLLCIPQTIHRNFNYAWAISTWYAFSQNPFCAHPYGLIDTTAIRMTPRKTNYRG
jgi:hypothetical protein